MIYNINTETGLRNTHLETDRIVPVTYVAEQDRTMTGYYANSHYTTRYEKNCDAPSRPNSTSLISKIDRKCHCCRVGARYKQKSQTEEKRDVESNT